MRVAYISDPLYLLHDTGAWHPESPQRLEAVEKGIEGLRKHLKFLSPIRVAESLLETVHTPELIASVKAHCEAEEPIDADTVCVRGSWDAALAAAGAGVVAVDAVAKGEIERAFCAVRPPGHHAESGSAMGFCLFNNVAVTARYAQRLGFSRVAILDFDVHHGNGTQEIFYSDPDVLYLSTHQMPAYPGSGSAAERGVGAGEGATFNFPFPPGSGDDEVAAVYEKRVPQILSHFRPDLVLVSAGYDLHERDPLAQFTVTTEGVRRIVRAVLSACDVPAVFMLEGGYDLAALEASVRVTMEELLRE